MELRVLHYFLAVAREQSISGAAEQLHLTQPTLSRQLKELEDELGKQLFIRGSRRVTLTGEGRLLCRRAEEILALVRKTEAEVQGADIAGEVYVGADETSGQLCLARAARSVLDAYPGIRLHLVSNDCHTLLEQLDLGLLDLAVVQGAMNQAGYASLPLPGADPWGVLLPKGHPLAQQSAVTPDALHREPVILSRQAMTDGALAGWLQHSADALNVRVTCSQIVHARRMVAEGIGCAVIRQSLADPQDTQLCFRPLQPALSTGSTLVWKKEQLLSKAAEALLRRLSEQTL